MIWWDFAGVIPEWKRNIGMMQDDCSGDLMR